MGDQEECNYNFFFFLKIMQIQLYKKKMTMLVIKESCDALWTFWYPEETYKVQTCNIIKTFSLEKRGRAIWIIACKLILIYEDCRCV